MVWKRCVSVPAAQFEHQVQKTRKVDFTASCDVCTTHTPRSLSVVSNVVSCTANSTVYVGLEVWQTLCLQLTMLSIRPLTYVLLAIASKNQRQSTQASGTFQGHTVVQRALLVEIHSTTHT